MSTNTGKFGNRFYTQINEATIGGPESASVTDIFGVVYIDPRAIQAGAKNWKRYHLRRIGTVSKSKNSLNS